MAEQKRWQKIRGSIPLQNFLKIRHLSQNSVRKFTKFVHEVAKFANPPSLSGQQKSFEVKYLNEMKQNFYLVDFSDYLFDFNTSLLWATGQNIFSTVWPGKHP